MDAKALLVAASADPVIEVNQQKLETDPLGKKVLYRRIDRRRRTGGGHPSRNRRLLRRQRKSHLGLAMVMWRSLCFRKCRFPSRLICRLILPRTFTAIT